MHACTHAFIAAAVHALALAVAAAYAEHALSLPKRPPSPAANLPPTKLFSFICHAPSLSVLRPLTHPFPLSRCAQPRHRQWVAAARARETAQSAGGACGPPTGASTDASTEPPTVLGDGSDGASVGYDEAVGGTVGYLRFMRDRWPRAVHVTQARVRTRKRSSASDSRTRHVRARTLSHLPPLPASLLFFSSFPQAFPSLPLPLPPCSPSPQPRRGPGRSSRLCEPQITNPSVAHARSA
eukprot:4719629-Pleurochrysis_carterae.AAC.1